MFDDTKIHQILQDALDFHTNDLVNNMPARSLVGRMRNAWLWVVGQRNEGACNANWTIADHYLNARYGTLTGESAMGWTFISLTYTSLRVMLDIADSMNLGRLVVPNLDQTPLRNVLAEGRCIVTPPSITAIAWARRGALDGELDRASPVDFTRRLLAPPAP